MKKEILDRKDSPSTEAKFRTFVKNSCRTMNFALLFDGNLTKHEFLYSIEMLHST